jgi:hypothetical protein
MPPGGHRSNQLAPVAPDTAIARPKRSVDVIVRVRLRNSPRVRPLLGALGAADTRDTQRRLIALEEPTSVEPPRTRHACVATQPSTTFPKCIFGVIADGPHRANRLDCSLFA